MSNGNDEAVMSKGLPSRDLRGVLDVVLDTVDEVAASKLAPDKKMHAVVRGVSAYANLYKTAILIERHAAQTGSTVKSLEPPKSEQASQQ